MNNKQTKQVEQTRIKSFQEKRHTYYDRYKSVEAKQAIDYIYGMLDHVQLRTLLNRPIDFDEIDAEIDNIAKNFDYFYNEKNK